MACLAYRRLFDRIEIEVGIYGPKMRFLFFFSKKRYVKEGSRKGSLSIGSSNGRTWRGAPLWEL